MAELIKAKSISDVEVQFVSLVDKAANRKSFLITKAEDGTASFSANGRIVKTDGDSHYVTGIVYEPMTEDTQGDFMTEEEIRKAAHWFAKNGEGIDIQHNFKKFEKAEVVENWIAKADFEIDKEKIRKGTWLMTVEITDPEVWTAVEKGEITGFSMGGKGVYSERDVDLESISKSEKKSIFKKFAEMFGLEVVEKGAFSEKHAQHKKSTAFWDAFYDLQEVLYRHNPETGAMEFEKDSEKIKECLSEFSEVIQEVLTGETETIAKAGKTLSAKNIERLKSIYENIGGLLEEAGKKEETMTKSEVMELIKETVKKFEKAEGTNPGGEPDEATKKFIVSTVKELLNESKKDDKAVTKAEVEELVKGAMEPLYKARGIPSNLDSQAEPVGKSEDQFEGVFI
jgi:hypothetical protein